MFLQLINSVFKGRVFFSQTGCPDSKSQRLFKSLFTVTQKQLKWYQDTWKYCCCKLGFFLSLAGGREGVPGKQRDVKRCPISTMQIQNAFCFYFLTWKCLFFLLFNLSFSLWSHLQRTGWQVLIWRFFSLSLFLFFFIFFLILSMILLFLTVFSGVSAPWEDKKAFQKGISRS